MPSVQLVNGKNVFKDDWVKYGFGDNLLPISTTEPFVIDYSAAYPHPILNTPLDIAHEACWDIYNRYPKPITLMVSGGVDSQAMAYAFKTAGVPVRYLMARYNDGINDDDIFSTSFYEDNQIPVDIIDLDIIHFHENEIFKWGRLYENHSPHLLSHCKIASMVTEGTVVSSGAVVTRRHHGEMDYSVFGLDRYARISGKPVVGFFFSYDPCLVWALRDLTNTVKDHYLSKVSIYNQAGFPVIAQPTGKRHGFEKLKTLYDDRPVSSKTRIRYAGKPSARPYDLLFRYPLMDMIRYSQSSKTRL